MLKPTKQQVLKSVYGYLIVTLAGILNAVSMFCFIDPCNLIAGGVSGLSSGVGYLVCHFIGDVNFAQFDLIKWIVYFQDPTQITFVQADCEYVIQPHN